MTIKQVMEGKIQKKWCKNIGNRSRIVYNIKNMVLITSQIRTVFRGTRMREIYKGGII